MIELKMLVQALTRILASCRIGWINEEGRTLVINVRSRQLKCDSSEYSQLVAHQMKCG